MKLTDLLNAIEILRKEGWIVEPPRKRRVAASSVRQAKRIGRPRKNGRRKGARRSKSN